MPVPGLRVYPPSIPKTLRHPVPSMLEGVELFTVDRSPITKYAYVRETENGSSCHCDHRRGHLGNRPGLRAALRAGTACAGPGALSANRPIRGYRRPDAQYLLLRHGAARRHLGKGRPMDVEEF